MANQLRMPKIGDKVIPRGSEAVYTVWSVSVSDEGTYVDLEIEGTLINRYHIPVRDLVWVDEE